MASLAINALGQPSRKFRGVGLAVSRSLDFRIGIVAERHRRVTLRLKPAWSGRSYPGLIPQWPPISEYQLIGSSTRPPRLVSGEITLRVNSGPDPIDRLCFEKSFSGPVKSELVTYDVSSAIPNDSGEELPGRFVMGEAAVRLRDGVAYPDGSKRLPEIAPECDAWQ